MSFRNFKRRMMRRIGLLPPKYMSFVGLPEVYRARGQSQFDLLRFFGMAEEHYLLDIGCGSLVCGRLAIPYLARGHYFGIEPEQWLIDEGIKHELGRRSYEARQPTFSNDTGFRLGVFGRSFDYLIAHSIMTHTSQAQIRTLMREAAAVMTPQAIFLATYLPGASDYTGAEWSYPAGITYTYERIAAIANESGLASARVAWPHPRQQWTVFCRGALRDLVKDRLRATAERSNADAQVSAR